MRKILLTLLPVILSGIALAQSPDPAPTQTQTPAPAKVQARSMSISPERMITLGRAQVLRLLAERKYDEAAAIRNYLRHYFRESDYIPFTPPEYIATLYWTQDYEELAAYVVRADSLFRPLPNKLLVPPDDPFRGMIFTLTYSHLAQLEAELDATGFQPADRDFYKLLLRWISTPATKANRAEISTLAEQFLETWPNSSQNRFVRTRMIQTPDMTGWGWGQGGGLQVLIPGGGLQKFNKPGMGVTFGCDMTSDRIYMGLAGRAGWSLKAYETDMQTWQETGIEKQRWFEAGLDFRTGVLIANNNAIALTPYGALGIGCFVAGDEYDSKTSTCMTLGGGMALDIKIREKKANLHSSLPLRDSYFALRIRYNITRVQYPKKSLMNTIAIELTDFSRRRR